jgi:signal transduction histidine kinase
MANDLLAVSQLEQNKMPIERTACDLVQMAGEVRTALRVQDAARPIEIEGPAAVTARCDGALVRRVLENLVTNGIRHTPAGSRLRISIASGGGRSRVAVHDEGQGIPPEVRHRIFEKFATAGPSRSRTVHSAGLGLAFCKLAIEAHGGTIGVETGVPVGSTFWFELPE